MARNRVMVLTPAGVGAIAVIRICGPDAPLFLQSHFNKPLTFGKCVHGKIIDDGRIIDDAVAVLCDQGQTVDLCVHGGAWAVQAAIDLACRHGFVLESDPLEGVDGEDLLQREMLAAVPLAQTELALRVLLAQPKAWENVSPRGADAAKILADHSLWWLLHPPQVAIIGIANVGKSTLANQLFAQERSITADVPGTTRDWIGETANLDGLAVTLIDTPGIRATEDPVERDAIAVSGKIIGKSDLVVLVLDAASPLTGEQAELLERWPDAMRVVNQVDRSPAWDLDKVQAVQTVATIGQGVEELCEQIRAYFGVRSEGKSEPRWWTLRQHAVLSRGIIG